MDVVEKIGRLLEDEAPHKRIAAAVVLGEIGARDPKVVGALLEMAKDPIEAFAKPALIALGQVGSSRSLPILLDALTRSSEVRAAAAQAIASLGPDALPAIRERLESATPEVRAQLSQLLPAVGGKLSFEMTLENLRGQPFDAANKVALSVRAEVKNLGEAERKAMRGQLEKFIAKKGTQGDEPALRAALKMLGYLELPSAVETLVDYLGASRAALVRVEAVTALRFGLREGASKKLMKQLVALLEDREPLVARAARDTLMVVPLGPDGAEALAELASTPNGELGLWVVARLGAIGGALAAKVLAPIASGRDRNRAQAAAEALATLPEGEVLLAKALAEADEEVGAQVLGEALAPLAKKLAKRERDALLKAGRADLKDHFALARRKLDAVRETDSKAWATSLRGAAEEALKKDPARSEAVYGVLCRSLEATEDDRYRFARLQLAHSPKDPHPHARQRDPALAELDRLAGAGFHLAKALAADKAVDDEARYYVAFHFAEQTAPESRAVGVALLEGLVEKAGRTKLGKAAKNKLALLQ